MSEGIVAKLDELLKDDRNFDTRAGLRFMGELVRDAFRYIEKLEGERDAEKKLHNATADQMRSFKMRIENIEKGLHDWMELRSLEKKEADEERRWWRRTIMGALLVLTITELAKWI